MLCSVAVKECRDSTQAITLSWESVLLVPLEFYKMKNFELGMVPAISRVWLGTSMVWPETYRVWPVTSTIEGILTNSVEVGKISLISSTCSKGSSFTSLHTASGSVAKQLYLVSIALLIKKICYCVSNWFDNRAPICQAHHPSRRVDCVKVLLCSWSSVKPESFKGTIPPELLWQETTER